MREEHTGSQSVMRDHHQVGGVLLSEMRGPLNNVQVCFSKQVYAPPFLPLLLFFFFFFLWPSFLPLLSFLSSPPVKAMGGLDTSDRQAWIQRRDGRPAKT